MESVERGKWKVASEHFVAGPSGGTNPSNASWPSPFFRSCAVVLDLHSTSAQATPTRRARRSLVQMSSRLSGQKRIKDADLGQLHTRAVPLPLARSRPPVSATSMHLTSYVSPAGHLRVLDFPDTVIDALFRQCDLASQFALGQTSHALWQRYKELTRDPQQTDPYQLTARDQWRHRQETKAAGNLTRRFRAEVAQRSLVSSLLPDMHTMLHASLSGHLSQKHLHFILEHPEPTGYFLRAVFAELVTGCLCGKLNMSVANSNIVMLTLKLYHSRQAGFTDTELDK